MGRALAAMNFTEPTPIQVQAIPVLMSGRDLVGQARTGTGKTAAFGIPILERLDTSINEVQALVLVPTRELCVQVAAEITRLGASKKVSVVAVYGGQPIPRQLQALAQGAHIVVGTPGRIQDHMSRGTLSLNKVRFAVLDEADEMLDIGFADDMEFILSRTPRARQTALFSATLPPFVRVMVRRHLRQPEWVRVIPEDDTPSAVDQVYYEVAENDRLDGLREVLDQDPEAHAIIFRRTQRGVDWLAERLKRHGYKAEAIHGGLRQGLRDSVMKDFRAGDLKYLIATNVAARGLDIPELARVINFDMPESIEEYTHRIGRTGRMGREGQAVTFVGEWDFEALDALIAHVGPALRQGKLKVSPESVLNS